MQSKSGWLKLLPLLAFTFAFVSMGIISASASTLVKINAPGAGTAAGQGTVASVINASGVVAGYYVDANNVHHGFQRAEH